MKLASGVGAQQDDDEGALPELDATDYWLDLVGEFGMIEPPRLRHCEPWKGEAIRGSKGKFPSSEKNSSQ
jgi:hypothetical protein